MTQSPHYSNETLSVSQKIIYLVKQTIPTSSDRPFYSGECWRALRRIVCTSHTEIMVWGECLGYCNVRQLSKLFVNTFTNKTRLWSTSELYFGITLVVVSWCMQIAVPNIWSWHHRQGGRCGSVISLTSGFSNRCGKTLSPRCIESSNEECTLDICGVLEVLIRCRE